MLACSTCPWTGEAYELQTYDLLTSTVEGCPVCGGEVRPGARVVPRQQAPWFADAGEAAEPVAHRRRKERPPDAVGRAGWQGMRDPRTGEIVEEPDDVPS